MSLRASGRRTSLALARAAGRASAHRSVRESRRVPPARRHAPTWRGRCRRSSSAAVADGASSSTARSDGCLASSGTRSTTCRARCSVPMGGVLPLDHCALVVHLDGERWFVDVGFGDCCMVPVRMDDGEHDAVPRRVRFAIDSDRSGCRSGRSTARGATACRARSSRAHAGRLHAAQRVTSRPSRAWRGPTRPFATRATAADGSRVTLRNGVLRVREGAASSSTRPSTNAGELWPSCL